MTPSLWQIVLAAIATYALAAPITTAIGKALIRAWHREKRENAKAVMDGLNAAISAIAESERNKHSS